MTPSECTHPRCSEPSLFSTVGMVGGRYWPLCHDHAHEYLQDQLNRIVVLAEALAQVPRRGQLTLVESR